MASVDPVMFQAFQRETAGVVPEFLRSWAIQVLLAGLPFEARIAERDRALRAAAALLGTDLSTAERVRRIHAEMGALARAARPSHPDLTTLHGCLAHALLARDLVPTKRQLWRILGE